MIYVLLITSGILNGVAQLLRKMGLNGFETKGKIFSIAISLLSNTYFISGLLLYAISIVIRFYVLSKTEVSFAYPFIALAYIIVILGGYFLLGENINILRIVGILLIIGGIIFISRS